MLPSRTSVTIFREWVPGLFWAKKPYVILKNPLGPILTLVSLSFQWCWKGALPLRTIERLSQQATNNRLCTMRWRTIPRRKDKLLNRIIWVISIKIFIFWANKTFLWSHRHHVLQETCRSVYFWSLLSLENYCVLAYSSSFLKLANYIYSNGLIIGLSLRWSTPGWTFEIQFQKCNCSKLHVFTRLPWIFFHR